METPQAEAGICNPLRLAVHFQDRLHFAQQLCWEEGKPPLSTTELQLSAQCISSQPRWEGRIASLQALGRDWSRTGPKASSNSKNPGLEGNPSNLKETDLHGCFNTSHCFKQVLLIFHTSMRKRLKQHWRPCLLFGRQSRCNSQQ